jgi:uncharacterized protein YxeA
MELIMNFKKKLLLIIALICISILSADITFEASRDEVGQVCGYVYEYHDVQRVPSANKTIDVFLIAYTQAELDAIGSGLIAKQDKHFTRITNHAGYYTIGHFPVYSTCYYKTVRVELWGKAWSEPYTGDNVINIHIGDIW